MQLFCVLMSWLSLFPIPISSGEPSRVWNYGTTPNTPTPPTTTAWEIKSNTTTDPAWSATSTMTPSPRRASNSKANPDTVDYRLFLRLEAQVGEKAQIVQSELRETNRRLQALEWQNAEILSAVEGFKAELQRFSQQQSYVPRMEYGPWRKKHDNTGLENRIENLSKGLKVMISSMRMLNSDIATMKTNLTQLENKTQDILQSNTELLTKQFFRNELHELRHEHHSHHSCPTDSKFSDVNLPKNCKELQLLGKEAGLYKIQPHDSFKPFLVFCDMDTKGGGWTVIQNRYDGSQEFYQSWHAYKHGFGNLGGEFWLGLENIYYLTGHEVNELLILLEDFNLQKAYAHYGAFSVGSEVEGFPLKVLGGYNGDAGDSLTYHAGNKFSTKDVDQDGWSEGSCAQAHGGAWWYRSCDTCNLNGRYLSGQLPEQYIFQGMYWGEFGGAQYSLMKAKIMVRPRDSHSPPLFADNSKNVADTNPWNSTIDFIY